MKKLFIFCLLVLSVRMAAQTPKLLSKIKTGDTLKVSVERMSDIGLYDRDLLRLVKTKEEYILTSEKRGRRYSIDKEVLKSFQTLEKDGMKQKNPGVKHDVYTLSVKGETSTFKLPASELANFMQQLK